MNKKKSNTLEQLRTLKTLIDNKRELKKIDKQMKDNQKECDHIEIQQNKHKQLNKKMIKN